MTNNQSLVPVQNQNSDVQGPVASLPAMVALTSKTGRVVGYRQHFTQSLGAKQIKERLTLQNPGLSKREINEKVQTVLRGEIDIRKLLGRIWLESAYEQNYVPNEADLRSKTGRLGLTKVEPVKKEPTVAEKRKAAMDLLGLTEEEYAKIEAAKAKAKAKAAAKAAKKPGQQTLDV